MQTGKAIARIVFDSFPHQQVVWPQMLKRKIRGPEFVYGIATMMEENESPNCPAALSCNRHDSLAGFQHISCDIVEKPEWLRRHSMSFSGQAMKLIERSD